MNSAIKDKSPLSEKGKTSKKLPFLKGIKAQKLLLYKKILILVFTVITAVVFLVLPSDEDPYTVFKGYFNTFSSAEEFTEIELKQEMRQGVKVASYDIRSDVYVTAQDYHRQSYESLPDEFKDEISGEFNLFGFSSQTEEFIPPSYLTIVAIKGDYAIVVEPRVDGETVVPHIGVVKFRGENAGNRTDFDTPYTGLVSQIRFVGDDYIAVMNDISDIKAESNTITFYDYKTSHKLLEVFKVRADSTYSFMKADNNLVAMTNEKADFYKVNTLDENGYLIATDTYRPFPEDTEEDLTDIMTTMVSYLGNNWFLRQGYIQIEEEESSSEERDFIEEYMDGKFILIDSFDELTGMPLSHYLLMRSDRYNSQTKINRSNDKLVPDMVANKYNEDSTRDIADYLNNSLEEGIDGKIAYYPPSMPVGALPKDGMSIVYYYYFPYENQPERYVVSFVMMDDNANIYHPQENIFMPPLFVDGAGVQISDPDYEMGLGDVQIIDENNKIQTLKEYNQGNYGYQNIAYNNGALIAAEYSLREDSTDMYYAAFEKESGRQITHFKFLELSIFVGDYAIGMYKVNDDYRYCRIDKTKKFGQNETLLNDVYAVRNGVYVTTDGEKVGLKTFAGEELLPNEYDNIDVIETFLQDGKFVKSTVTATKDNKGYIFELN
ncbi:MAG: hypothetical protein ACOCWI_02645 [Bacillota bacterium]